MCTYYITTYIYIYILYIICTYYITYLHIILYDIHYFYSCRCYYCHSFSVSSSFCCRQCVISPRQPLPAPAVQRTLGACSCNLVDDGAGKTTKMGGECEPERRWFIIFQESHFNHQLTLTAFINQKSTNSFHFHFSHQLKVCTFTSSLQQISEGELQPRRDSHGQFDETSLLRGWAWYGDMPSTRTFFLLYKYRPKHTHTHMYIYIMIHI